MFLCLNEIPCWGKKKCSVKDSLNFLWISCNADSISCYGLETPKDSYFKTTKIMCLIFNTTPVQKIRFKRFKVKYYRT